MNSKKMNELVGKSFEDLTMEEMKELQGGVDVNSTVLTTVSPVTVISPVIIPTVVSLCK